MLKTTCVLLCFIGFGTTGVAELQSFVDYKLVPDILSSPPAYLLSVTFPSGVQADEGGIVSLDQVVEQPTLSWNADPDRFYTLIFVDPDATGHAEQRPLSFLHWLVANIPGDDVTSGKILAEFIPSQPPAGSGLHRYVFLVYEQPSVLGFNGLPDYTILENRRWFSLEAFSSGFRLGNPLAGNFYQAVNPEEI